MFGGILPMEIKWRHTAQQKVVHPEQVQPINVCLLYRHLIHFIQVMHMPVQPLKIKLQKLLVMLPVISHTMDVMEQIILKVKPHQKMWASILQK